jgi:hypothetical protein
MVLAPGWSSDRGAAGGSLALGPATSAGLGGGALSLQGSSGPLPLMAPEQPGLPSGGLLILGEDGAELGAAASHPLVRYRRSRLMLSGLPGPRT